MCTCFLGFVLLSHDEEHRTIQASTKVDEAFRSAPKKKKAYLRGDFRRATGSC